MVIVRIENINDQFCKVFLLYCFVIISSVKFIKFKVCDRFCIPYTQCIYYVIAISNDWHIIRNCHDRLIVFLDKFIFSCNRIFLETDISAKTYFFCVLFTANLKRISFFQPVVRNLYLISIFDFLFEHSVTITDSTSICRVIQCSELRLPTCSRRFPRDIGKERPCLNHHIGRCDGFCRPDGPDATEYRRRIAQAVRLFEGRLRQVTAELTAQMTAAAEALDFEQAAALRDRIRALSVLSKNQKVIAGICADTDVWGVYTGPARAGCAVLHIENGDLLGRRVEVLPAAEDDAALLGAVVPQYYLDRELLPREILLPLPVEDMDTLSALLTERCGHTVTLRVPQRGQRRELLDIACRNAKEEVERVTSDAERTAGILRLLQELAGLPVLPRRMESYDISHTGGADQVASMVVFVDGRPLKRDYRRFQIQSCGGPDDYGAMAEVLERRFRRYLDGDGKFSPLPDLLLIDGGVQHARVAEEVAAKLHLSVPVLGMVKDDRHRTRALVTAQGMEIGIQTPPALFALIGRVQEEVHRFAITYHHQKHAKNAYRSQLDGIAGVGEARKRLLLQRFGTVKAIRAAGLLQLEEVLPKPAARAVYDHFHPENMPKENTP